VKFHDGSPFTADDAVFSLERAREAPSQRAFQLKGVTAMRKLDALTSRSSSKRPTPCCPRSCSTWPS
jgi:peptide/nickel transport system substrate-binding protein